MSSCLCPLASWSMWARSVRRRRTLSISSVDRDRTCLWWCSHSGLLREFYLGRNSQNCQQKSWPLVAIPLLGKWAFGGNPDLFSLFLDPRPKIWAQVLIMYFTIINLCFLISCLLLPSVHTHFTLS